MRFLRRAAAVLFLLGVSVLAAVLLPSSRRVAIERRRAAPRTRAFLQYTKPPLLERRHNYAEGLGPRILRRNPSPTQPFCRLTLAEQLLWGEAIAREEHSRQ